MMALDTLENLRPSQFSQKGVVEMSSFGRLHRTICLTLLTIGLSCQPSTQSITGTEDGTAQKQIEEARRQLESNALGAEKSGETTPGNAGYEPKGPLDKIEDDGAAGNFRIVDEFIEQKLRAGPKRQLGVVAQPDLARTFRADLDEFVLANVVTCCKAALVSLVFRRNKVDDPDGRTDLIARRGKCRRSAPQERDTQQCW